MCVNGTYAEARQTVCLLCPVNSSSTIQAKSIFDCRFVCMYVCVIARAREHIIRLVCIRLPRYQYSKYVKYQAWSLGFGGLEFRVWGLEFRV